MCYVCFKVLCMYTYVVNGCLCIIDMDVCLVCVCVVYVVYVLEVCMYDVYVRMSGMYVCR